MAETRTVDICPYLRQREDETLRYRFPHIRNFCYKPRKPSPVDLPYQENTCLSPRHLKCPVFLEKEVKRLPTEIRGSGIERIPIFVWMLVALSILLCGIVLSIMFSTRIREILNIGQDAIEDSNDSGDLFGTSMSDESMDFYRNDLTIIKNNFTQFRYPELIENETTFDRNVLNPQSIPITGTGDENPFLNLNDGDSLLSNAGLMEEDLIDFLSTSKYLHNKGNYLGF